ncbi:MAG TPA: DUF4157 domain-containing protein [Ideonella sp.]|uniref:eCIS core domain-containing protein n=1 Tax=Ideonella sp. TaxID=1929293 RepID=UPI002B5C1503|nr:DUF4157 domain-containing protein [Ideonella sp.]HSI51427.1 DUF4157 domain-containing protein [Ideonella sp.]
MQTHALKPAMPARRPLAPHVAALKAGVRPKLMLGGAHDDAEKQADRMAAQALRQRVPDAHAAGDPMASRTAVRRALAPAARPAADAPPEVEDEQALPESLEREIAALQAGGQPLPPPLRADMEARFGLDFSAVRIHTGPQAARLNETLHAHAFAVGEHIAFHEGRFQPSSETGRFLLAHELAHVAQQRGVTAVQAPAAAASPVRRSAEPGVRTVRRGLWGDLYDSVADTLGDIADWAIEKVRELGWQLLESISPEFARTVRAIVDEGLLNWLGRQVARAWEGFIGGLQALVPFDGPRQLIALFGGLVSRAAGIAVALASGRCEPLMAAIGELKTFVTETVGVAWDKLTEFLRPIGEFFTGLWRDFGAPALQWLQNFGGAVWAGIQDLGRRLWDWVRPVRDAAARVWHWFSDLLFGSDTGEESTGSSGGVLGWISAKAGEAWDWVRERTRPVWQPVADMASRVADLIPPAFVRQMGEQAQRLSTGLDGAAEGMDGGEGVPAARQSLASVLPSIQTLLSALRGLIVGAGAWLGERIGGVASLIGGLVTRLRASDWLAWLASAFGWLTDALDSLLAWAREQVGALFARLVQGFDALTPFLQLVLETVRKLITVAGDLLQLPLLILGGLWQRVPACIREPIENFIRNQILARIPVFGQFFTDAELWPRVQQTALNILRRLFVDGDLPGAAWAFFQAVLRLLNIPAQLVVQILAKAARAIGDILTNPIGFLINTLRAVKAGFGLFFERIGTHLLNGVTGWLFGQLREAGVQPPADFSLRAVLGFVLDVLGVTVENVFRRLSERVGPEVVARLRRMLNMATGVWNFVSVLVNEGAAGLWREVQERLSSLWDTVMQGISAWITEVVISRVSRWLTALLDPSGIMAVVNSLVAIYNAIESFMQYLREMLEIVSRVLDGVLDIARGSIDTAASFLENALGSALPVAIGFLANQLGLGRLGQRIREMLARVQALVDGAIDWLIDRAIRGGRALLDLARRGGEAVRGAVARVREWWRARQAFQSGGETHNLYIEGSGASAHLMVASTPTSYERFLAGLAVPPEREADKQDAIRLARELGEAMRAASAESADRGDRGPPRAGASAPSVDHGVVISAKLAELAPITGRLMLTGPGHQRSGDPQYGGIQGGAFGSSVTVEPLTRVHQRGSEPGSGLADARGHWNKLRLRYHGGATLYVRGHLLNDNLGGPGDDWRNLTPLTQDANNRASTSMLHAFETPVKTAIDEGKTVRFIVTAHYGRTPIDVAAARAAGETVKAEVAEAEQHVPRTVTCQAVEVSPANGSGQRLPASVTVDNNIGSERPEDYQLAPGTAPIDVPATFSALQAEANAALAADPTLTWTAFRTGGRNGRIERLGEAEAARVTLLQNQFRDHHLRRLFDAESAAIAAMAGLMSWNDFKRGRSAYDTGRPEDERLADARIAALEAQFNRKRDDDLRPRRRDALVASAGSAPADQLWGDFRRTNSAFSGPGGLTDDQVQEVRSAFERRAGATAGAAPAPH